MDPISAVCLVGAACLLIASWVYMIIIASDSGDTTWTLSSMFLPPLAYFYGLFAWDKAGDAIKLALLGLFLLWLGLS